MAQQERKVAVRYARALFEAVPANEHDAMQHALDELAQTWQESGELREVLLNPALSKADRLNVLKGLATRLRPGDHRFENLLGLLLHNSRLQILEHLAADFNRLVLESRAVVAVEVTSAYQLPQDERTGLAQLLERELQSGVVVTWQVKPEIIGGLIFRAGDRLLDSSIGGVLGRAKKELLV